MAESEAMQSIVKQATVDTATAMRMALRDADAGPRSAEREASSREPPRQILGRPFYQSPHLTGMPKTST